MSMHHRLVFVLLTSGFLAACATTNTVESAGDAEKPKCTKHELKFKVKKDECVEQVVKDTDCDCDAEAIIARACDTVEWKVIGKKKSISFDEADGSPFTWFVKADSQKISGEVEAGAARDKPYKYTVRVDGLSCELDPMIIVQR